MLPVTVIGNTCGERPEAWVSVPVTVYPKPTESVMAPLEPFQLPL
jgi:hypothetical protein